MAYIMGSPEDIYRGRRFAGYRPYGAEKGKHLFVLLGERGRRR
jgi:hypothetical protein